MKIHGWKTADMDERYGVVDLANADAVRVLMNAGAKPLQKPFPSEEDPKCLKLLVRMKGLEPSRVYLIST